MKRISIGAAILLAATLTLPARAEAASDCQLHRYANLDMSTEQDGEVAVPLSIDGLGGLMLVDTGSVQSSISGTMANRLGVTPERSERTYMMIGGVRMDTSVTVHVLRLDKMAAKNMTLMVLPPKALHTDTMGMLGPDVMSNYDVEFDFAAGRMNVFSQDHCPGAVVYWTKTPFAAVPMRLDEGKHILIDVTLNGKQITAGVDTGSDHSSMTLESVQSIFGLKADDAALKPIMVASINGTRPVAVLHYPFAELDFQDVKVLHPDVEILPGGRFEAGGPQIVLGMSTLRQLHLYIAYGEKMIYLTPAEAR